MILNMLMESRNNIKKNEIATLAFGKFAMTEGWIPAKAGMTEGRNT